MRIQYMPLAIAIVCSLLAMSSYAQLSVSTNPVSPTSGSTIVTLKNQSCSAAGKAWQKLNQLSEYYDDRASGTSGDKRDAWCKKYDAVETVLSGIETYYEASCVSDESSDGSGGYWLEMKVDIESDESVCQSMTEEMEYVPAY